MQANRERYENNIRSLRYSVSKIREMPKKKKTCVNLKRKESLFRYKTVKIQRWKEQRKKRELLCIQWKLDWKKEKFAWRMQKVHNHIHL